MPIGARLFGEAPISGTGVTPQVSNQLVLRIGPTDVSALLLWDTTRHSKELNARDELEFTLLSSTGYNPAIGEEVTMYWRNAKVFVGSVHERDVSFLHEGTNVFTRTSVRCVDINEVADRRIVVEIFESQSAGDAVVQVVTKYLLSEGIFHGDIQDGPLITRMVVPYMTVAEFLDELCSQSGFHWNIDTNKFLNFFARTTSPAPFTITTGNAVFRGLTGKRTRNQYRNVQYVDGGRGITGVRTEQFKGDGTLRTFSVEYPLFEVPTIELNFNPQTVGIRGIDTDKQWYWNSDENAIGQEPTGPVLTTTDLLTVTYRGTFNVISIVEDSSAIIERKGVQGGTGRYEQLFRDDNIDGTDLVQEKGLSLLRRYAEFSDVIDFEVDIEGLDIGQIATVSVPELNQSGDYLIMKIDITFILSQSQVTRRFRVTATTGEVKGRFQDFFTQLLGSRQAIKLRDGEILQEVTAVHDGVSLHDTNTADLVNKTSDVCGSALCGYAEFG